MSTDRAFVKAVWHAAGTRLDIADVMSVLNAADTVRRGWADPAPTNGAAPADPVWTWTARCDECGDDTTDPHHCPHGREQCPKCVETWQCRACAREALDDRDAS